MANNYYDATGVLVLDQVTPVITALFRGFRLDASYPGNGQAYIARISESNTAQWRDVLEEMIVLAAQLDLPAPTENDDLSIPIILTLLAEHFGTDQNEGLESLIEHHSFEDEVDLEALFLIATCLDDGHHLVAIQFEGCWHCSKPRLFNFGGEGNYMSREFETFSSSGQALQLGSEIRQALLNEDLDKVATSITREAIRLLAGINDKDQRAYLQQRVAAQLQANPT